ncbi:MAG: protein translocase subunit SecF [Eubacteriales bacterium]|nr:protein translocase subunit SecF [Eubacteriales bacterium]
MKKKNNNFLNGLKNFKFSNKLPIWIAIPCVIILIAFLVVMSISIIKHSASVGFNIGIDFDGGTILSVTLGEEAHSDNANYHKHYNKIKNAIEGEGVSVSYVQTASGSTSAEDVLQFRYRNPSDDSNTTFKTNEKILAKVKALYPSLTSSQITYETIGKTAASDLLQKSAIAMAVSIVLILIYIIFRFEFVSGITAVICTIHDALLMFCFTLIFRIPINSSYIAATITIIAYSINNTIVIFDRCRETIKPIKGAKSICYEQIGDDAVHTTMTRSLYTTFTTLVTVALLAIFGSASMREFTVPIIIGLFVGLYSSIFLATPIWAKLSYAFDGLRLKRLEKKAAKESEDENGKPVKKAVVYEKSTEPKKAKKKPTVYVNPKKNTQFKKKK